MSTHSKHAKTYRYIVDLLTKSPMYRKDLIDLVTEKFLLSKEELRDSAAGSKKNNLRSEIGTAINEMHSQALIGIDSRGRYYLVSTKPVAVRIERCQKEIIKALSDTPMSKSDLKTRLKAALGTDKTVTTKDDDILATYMGQLLKKMLEDNVITLVGDIYALTPQISAKSDDVNELLALKSEFISRIHIKGGEFFENYFLSLLKKYCIKHGKTILECYVTGGSDDGGIDGVIKTEDSLGFKEVIMIQTKNRLDLTSETDVRGFYGAVYAKRGTRGIFATTSDFHPVANDFLDLLDDCVGINGDKIFAMAIECSYGIKRTKSELTLDEKIFS